MNGQKEYVQIDHNDLYPYLLVNIGSGVSMIKVNFYPLLRLKIELEYRVVFYTNKVQIEVIGTLKLFGIEKDELDHIFF